MIMATFQMGVARNPNLRGTFVWRIHRLGKQVLQRQRRKQMHKRDICKKLKGMTMTIS
jgi:hypothetical protein